MILEAGLFYTMLGLGIVLLIAKTPYRPLFQFVGCLLFMTVGMMLFMDYDVAFVTVTSDGTNVINQTNYVIGTPSTDFNENSKWLAVVFLLMSIMLAFAATVGLIHIKWETPNN